MLGCLIPGSDRMSRGSAQTSRAASASRSPKGLGAAILTAQLIGCAPPAPAPPRVPSPVAQSINTDGIGNITAPDTIVNRYARLGGDVSKGATVLKLAADRPVSTLGLQPHDLILLYQAQGAQMVTYNSSLYGATTSVNGAGSLELAGVSAVDAENNTLTIYDWCGGLQHFHPAATTQIIRVPQYQLLIVSAGASIVAPPWDGSVGGVLAVSVEGRIELAGELSTTGRGFRGGAAAAPTGLPRPANTSELYRSTSRNDGGNKGESIAGDKAVYAQAGQYGRGAPVNGGGGGNTLFSGGGGGGGGGDASSWSGHGVMIASTASERLAWQLDPAYIANRSQLTLSSGGGRGGYSYAEADLDPTLFGPGNLQWRGDSRREQGGLGGEPLASSPRTGLYFGGGGGSGDNTQSTGGAGGAGGGLILVLAAHIGGSGAIRADGQAGADIPLDIGGGGGGGAGGSILLATRDRDSPLDLPSVSARGGAGGSIHSGSLPTGGPGGGGGGGYIMAPPNPSGGTRIEGGASGYASSRPLQVFPQNGATDGHDGRITPLDESVPFAGIPACTTSDLGVTLTVDPSPATGREPVRFNATVTDLGPTPASDIEFYLQLPATAEFLAVDAPLWTCGAVGEIVTCRRQDLSLGSPSTLVITARPPLSATAALATATVRSRSDDPIITNNVSDVALDNPQPLSGNAFGGGFACAMAPGVPSQLSPICGALGLLLGGIAKRRQLRQAVRRRRRR